MYVLQSFKEACWSLHVVDTLQTLAGDSLLKHLLHSSEMEMMGHDDVSTMGTTSTSDVAEPLYAHPCN